MRALAEDLRRMGLATREGVSLRRYTTVRTGGKAALMVFPQTLGELEKLWLYLRRRGVPYFLLAGGSKVLFPDEGFSGVVINLRLLSGFRELSPGRLEVLCGTPVAMLIAYGLKRGFRGFEFLAGIPATLGGAIRMNAGAFGQTTGTFIEEVWFLDSGGLRKVDRTGLSFRYRRLVPEGLVAKAVVRLLPASPPEVRERVKTLIRERRCKQPLGQPSFGSTFLNPDTGPPAGWLIEKAGLKGKRRGGARISPRHANFIVNEGGARSRDILDLMEEARERVFHRFGILLQTEVRVVRA